ncbi:uncharacterized protein LOC141524278 isoform X2 [Cotesia typhae]|uniref:uncharacterized protein LOC141524278 isoform X2 n=1 Tax=Cotesia typhae TaxID=2053667 RepID=UPI003D689D5F
MEGNGGSTAMEVEELKAILESKGGSIMEGEEEEEEIIYEGEESAVEEIQGEDIVEIIEEIEVVESEEEEEEEEVVVEEEQPQAVSVTESIHDDSSQSQDKVHQTVDSRSADDNQNNYSQQIVTYDADEDWTLEESDPLELKSNHSAKNKENSEKVTVNGNKIVNTKSENVYRTVKYSSSEYEEAVIIRSDEDHHEIVKNTENDLVYTVLGGKKSDKSKQEDPRYIKMERLDENIAEEEGTIYYEDGEMGTLYMTPSVNDGEQYQYEEQALEQDDQEQGEQQEQWDGTNEVMMEEQGDENQDQIYLHEDEDGQLYFKDENGIMQPVYLTEDGNYAIADTSEDPQDNQELKLQQKSDESILGVQELDTNSLRQGSSTSSPINNDVDNEDNTVTISLIISEDENGLKRTQVIIPTPDALKCEICQKSFKTQFQLLRHNRLKHAREEDITTRNFPCDLCPKRFPDQNSLAKHRKTHTGDRPFQCLECQDTFPTAPALRRHMSSHNPESKPLPCIYCGRRFLDKPALEKHEKSHLAAEQQRGHVCDICNKTFMTPTDLMVHKKNHDPDKKFDCEVCGREFNRLNNLQRHMMVHQQQQQGQSQEILSCDVCGITYKFMSSLTRHMVTSHMNPEKLRQQAEEQRRKRENNYKRYLENRKMYETQHGTGYGKRSYRSAMSSDPDDDFA